MSMYRFALAALFCSAVLAPSALSAQTYPSKPIHFILPYVPGGIIDTAGRNLALRLSESLGVSVVPENRPGAGGMVGADVVARSAPDGYTMLLTDPALVSNPTLQSDVPYDLFKGLQAVSIVGSSPAVIVASLTLPVKTFSEFIAYAKANPDKLNFASAGVGTAPHLAGEMIKLAAGIEMTHVPYRGIGAAYPDVMSGKVQLAFSSIAGAVPFTADNRVRPIATTGPARSPVYPDVPTVAESGLPGFDIDLWIGIYAPAGLPPAVLAKLNGEISKAQGAAASRAEGGFRQDRRHAARDQPRAGRDLHARGIREMEEGDRRGQDQAGVADSLSPFRTPMSARFRTSGGLRRAQHWCTCPARGISLRANRCAQPRRNALDAATNLDVTVRIVGIDDRKGHGNAFFQVARFDPSLRGVHPNKTILVITPDRRHLRRSVGHDGSQIRKRLLPLQ